MRLAVLQSHSPAGDLDAACVAIETALRAAAAAGASVLVVPEVFLPGYNHPEVAALALAPDAAPLRRLASLCAETATALVVGYAEAAGQTYNAALCIGAEGQVLAHYRKVQLYGAREKALYTPGDGYCIFDLAGRKAALLICYDIEFAPHVAALARAGAELILVPTANMAPFHHVVRHTVPAMAANHGVSIAYANYCGSERDLTYTGGSLIAGPHGEVLAQAGDHPALLIADLPVGDPKRLSTQFADFRSI